MTIFNRYRLPLFTSLRGTLATTGAVLNSLWGASITDTDNLNDIALHAFLGSGALALTEESLMALTRYYCKDPLQWPAWAKATQYLLPTIIEFLTGSPLGKLILQQMFDSELMSANFRGWGCGGFVLFILVCANKYGIDKYGIHNLPFEKEATNETTRLQAQP